MEGLKNKASNKGRREIIQGKVVWGGRKLPWGKKIKFHVITSHRSAQHKKDLMPETGLRYISAERREETEMSTCMGNVLVAELLRCWHIWKINTMSLCCYLSEVYYFGISPNQPRDKLIDLMCVLHVWYMRIIDIWWMNEYASKSINDHNNITFHYNINTTSVFLFECLLLLHCCFIVPVLVFHSLKDKST